MFDFHFFWKVYRGELFQPLGTPKTDQLPGKKIADRLVALRGYQGHILYSGRSFECSANVATLTRKSWPNALDEKPG